MIQVSDAYKELVKSNIRPKCEPIIKISGIDNTGEKIELVWNAKNIKDLKYKRGIDPVGRELPYMELTWTEIYTGKLNAQSYPEKYNNIAKYMAVELYFVQDLGFYNTWKTLFTSRKTWKELFSQIVTWKQLKKQSPQEVIKVPKMFLTAKPVIKGQTITWTARDFLFFLVERQVKSFKTGIDFLNPIRYFLVNERGNFISSPDLFNAITSTNINLAEFVVPNDPKIYRKIIFDGQTKDLIVKYAQLRNLYFDFSEDGSAQIKNLFNLLRTDFVFNSNVMYNSPIITQSSNIATYSFKSYYLGKKTENKYKKSYTQKYQIKNVDVYRFDYDEYGEIVESDSNGPSEINFALSFNKADIEVTPITWSKKENTISKKIIGETYEENNPCNPYSDKEAITTKRFNYLSNYFNDKSSSLEFEILPNLAVTTSDYGEVETNLYDDNGEKIHKYGVVVKTEISYNGSLKEKVYVHELTKE